MSVPSLLIILFDKNSKLRSFLFPFIRQTFFVKLIHSNRTIRTSGLRYKRRVNGDVVGDGPYLLQAKLPDAKLGGSFVLQDRIKGNDIHAEALHSVGHLAAYAAHPEDREGLAGQLVSGVQFPVPSAFLQRLCGLRHVARERGDQGAC